MPKNHAVTISIQSYGAPLPSDQSYNLVIKGARAAEWHGNGCYKVALANEPTEFNPSIVLKRNAMLHILDEETGFPVSANRLRIHVTQVGDPLLLSFKGTQVAFSDFHQLLPANFVVLSPLVFNVVRNHVSLRFNLISAANAPLEDGYSEIGGIPKNFIMLHGKSGEDLGLPKFCPNPHTKIVYHQPSPMAVPAEYEVMRGAPHQIPQAKAEEIALTDFLRETSTEEDPHYDRVRLNQIKPELPPLHPRSRSSSYSASSPKRLEIVREHNSVSDSTA